MFYDNDTKVNGFCGDLWEIFADYLNFTYVKRYGECFLFLHALNNKIFYVIAHICLEFYTVHLFTMQWSLLIVKSKYFSDSSR